MNDYDVSGTLTDEQALGLMAILGSFMIIFFIIALVFYVVDVIARFKYLRIRNYKNNWMAFIPLVNVYACVDATYGNVEKIRIMGIELPAMCVKLYAVIIAILTGIVTRIEAISSIGTTVFSIISIIIGVVVYIDMIERLGKEVSVGFSVLANIIGLVGSIKLISACRGHVDGQFPYDSDPRVLKSQEGVGQGGGNPGGTN